jgi:hypothetical protein
MDDTTNTPTQFPQDDNKPTISHREVSWHANVAAIRARKLAESQGIDPAAKDSLIYATTGSPLHPPVTLGTLWAIEAAEPYIDPLCKGHKSGEQALLVHTLLHPEDSLLSLLAGDIDSFAAALLLTACEIPPEQALTIEDHFYAETARLRHLTGGHTGAPSKKFPAPPSHSTAAPPVAP